jgi:hypothetical protein
MVDWRLAASIAAGLVIGGIVAGFAAMVLGKAGG